MKNHNHMVAPVELFEVCKSPHLHKLGILTLAEFRFFIQLTGLNSTFMHSFGILGKLYS